MINKKNNNNNKFNKSRWTNLNSLESIGPGGIRIRGSANNIIDKYNSLSKTAIINGDMVLAEEYLQHVEHYERLLANYARKNNINNEKNANKNNKQNEENSENDKEVSDNKDNSDTKELLADSNKAEDKDIKVAAQSNVKQDDVPVSEKQLDDNKLSTQVKDENLAEPVKEVKTRVRKSRVIKTQVTTTE